MMESELVFFITHTLDHDILREILVGCDTERVCPITLNQRTTLDALLPRLSHFDVPGFKNFQKDRSDALNRDSAFGVAGSERGHDDVKAAAAAAPTPVRIFSLADALVVVTPFVSSSPYDELAGCIQEQMRIAAESPNVTKEIDETFISDEEVDLRDPLLDATKVKEIGSSPEKKEKCGERKDQKSEEKEDFQLKDEKGGIFS